jgi:hypothetical protein
VSFSYPSNDSRTPNLYTIITVCHYMGWRIILYLAQGQLQCVEDNPHPYSVAREGISGPASHVTHAINSVRLLYYSQFHPTNLNPLPPNRNFNFCRSYAPEQFESPCKLKQMIFLHSSHMNHAGRLLSYEAMCSVGKYPSLAKNLATPDLSDMSGSRTGEINQALRAHC